MPNNVCPQCRRPDVMNWIHDQKTDRFICAACSDNNFHGVTVIPNDILEKLTRYSTLALECDGMTRVVSYVLRQANIPHDVYMGLVYQGEEKLVPIHYWVTLPDARIIDYKLRMWVGDRPDVPHGIFIPSDFPDFEYAGRIISMPVSALIFGILTGGKS